MKRIIIMLVMICSCTNSFAQQDKLYLVGNGYLKGYLLTGSEDQLSFVIDHVDTVSFSWKAINGVKLNGVHNLPPLVSAKIDSINGRYTHKFDLYFDLGGVFDDSTEETQLGGTVSAVGVFKWKQYVQFGLGMGLYRYSTFNAFPIFIQYQGDFSKTDYGFYYYGAIGKAVSWRRSSCDCNFNDVEGGRLLKAGLGYKWQIGEIKVHATFGWIQQKMSADFDPGFTIFAPHEMSSIKIRQKLNGLELRFGIRL